MNIDDNILTLENAKKWDESEDKFNFCLGLLQQDIQDDKTLIMIDELEARLEELLIEEEMGEVNDILCGLYPY